MEYWIFIILALIFFLVAFKIIIPEQGEQNTSEHMLGSFTNRPVDRPEDINITINTENTSRDYYDGYGCSSPHCARRSFWYGDTPFVWNNGTRVPRWRWPYYAYIHDWFRDTYAYPYPYYY